MDMTDEELAMMYIGGSNEAFDELLERNKSRIYNYILFVVKDEDTADELFQDTFVKVVFKLHEGKYHISGKFSFWVTRIAHNIIIDWFRRNGNERVVEPNEDNDLSNLKAASVIEYGREHEIMQKQIFKDVRRIMDSLPANQREVVYMRYYQDLSFKEIAELTGVSINTSLGRMRYAIHNMRRIARQNDIMLNV